MARFKPTRFMAEDSRYDKKAADYAVSFIECLSHTKGTWAGKKFELLDWQEQIIRDLFGILKPNGYRQFNTAYIEIPKKNGKQLALHTPIPTPYGFTTMGDIQIGDELFDEKGNICHVIAKSPVDYEEQGYIIRFKDGEEIIAGARYLWTGELTNGTRRKRTITTEELYQRSCDANGCYRFRIPIAEAFTTTEKELPVDPYLMGYWLGNGNAVKPEITIQTCDIPEVLDRIWPWHKLKRRWKNTGDSEICPVPDLKKVLLKSFHDKKIPIEYLRASVSQRFDLLQGLMDSDGAISNLKGQAIYTSTEKALAESVSELLWSLGIKNAITTAVSTQRADWSKPSSECGRVATGETLYYVKFTAFDDMPIAGLKRNPKSRSHFRYIDSIEKIENPGMQCIQVDSPSHLYCVGRSFLPTHNSELAAAVALLLTCGDGEERAEVYGCAADRQQAAIVFDVAADMVRMCPALSKRVKILASQKRIVYLPTNSFYQVLSAEDTFTAMWSGALFKNGFAYQLNTDRSNVECSILEGKSGWDKQGLDKDLEQATISVFANAIEETGENTKTSTFKVQNKFKQPVDHETFGVAPYNPFIFLHQNTDKNRTEVHLVNHGPTSKENMDLFNTHQDLSDKDKGIYYVSDQNYPFAIHLSDVESFSTTEKEAIDKSYPRFASWAQSGGTTDKDWYLKK